MSKYPKLTAVCDTSTHLWLGVDVSIGPSQDSPQLKPAVTAACRVAEIDTLLGDKGYDAEHNHRFCREELGIRRTLIPVRRRSSLSPQRRKWPETPYRREMRARFDRENYGQRWQAESAFSQHKRRFGSALRARQWPTQRREIYVRVLAHNVSLIAR